MDKVDLKDDLKSLYAPSAREFSIVEVPRFQFYAVDGTGDPNTSPAYTRAVEALYALSYATKFASKAALSRDYVVAPLEGLWWADHPKAFTDRSKTSWSWTMLMRQPDWITREVAAEARAKASAKSARALELVRTEWFEEGLSVQILHVGAYDDEGPTIARMHQEFMPANGLAPRAKHHEIYLSDPRRVARSNLKTVLRQPVKRIS